MPSFHQILPWKKWYEIPSSGGKCGNNITWCKLVPQSLTFRGCEVGKCLKKEPMAALRVNSSIQVQVKLLFWLTCFHELRQRLGAIFCLWGLRNQSSFKCLEPYDSERSSVGKKFLSLSSCSIFDVSKDSRHNWWIFYCISALTDLCPGEV